MRGLLRLYIPQSAELATAPSVYLTFRSKRRRIIVTSNNTSQVLRCNGPLQFVVRILWNIAEWIWLQLVRHCYFLGREVFIFILLFWIIHPQLPLVVTSPDEQLRHLLLLAILIRRSSNINESQAIVLSARYLQYFHPDLCCLCQAFQNLGFIDNTFLFIAQSSILTQAPPVDNSSYRTPSKCMVWSRT